MSDIRFTKSRNDNRIRHVNFTPPTSTTDVKDGPRFSSNEATKANQKSPKTPPWNLFITSKSDEVNTANKAESKAGTIERLMTGDQVMVETKRDKDHTFEALKTQKDHTFEALKTHKDHTFEALKTQKDHTFVALKTQKDHTFEALKTQKDHTFVALKTQKDHTFEALKTQKDHTFVALKTHKDHTYEALKTREDSVKCDDDLLTFAQHTKMEENRDSKKVNSLKSRLLNEDNMFERQEHREIVERHGKVEKVKTSEIKEDEKRTLGQPGADFKSKDVKGDKVSNQNKKYIKLSKVDSQISHSVVSSNTAGDKGESVVSKVNSKTEAAKSFDNTKGFNRSVVAKCIESGEREKEKQNSAERNAESQHLGKKEMQKLAVHKPEHHKRSGNATAMNYSSANDQNISNLSASLQDQNRLHNQVNHSEAKESGVIYEQSHNKVKSHGKKASDQDHCTSHGQLMVGKSVPKMTVRNEGDIVLQNATPEDVDKTRHREGITLHTDIEDQALLRQERRRGPKQQEEQVHISEKACSDKQPLVDDRLRKLHELKHSLGPKEKIDDCKRMPSSMKLFSVEEDDIKRSSELSKRNKRRTSGSKPGKLTSLLSPEDCSVKSTSHPALDFIEKPPSAFSEQQLSSFCTVLSSSNCGVNSYSMSRDPSPTPLDSINQPNVTTSTVTNSCTSHSVMSRDKEDKHNIFSSFSTNAKPNTTSSISTQSCVEKSINKCDTIDSSDRGANSILEQTKASSCKHHSKTELTAMFLKSDNITTDDTKQFENVDVSNEPVIGSYNESKQVSSSKNLSETLEKKEFDSVKCENQIQEPTHSSVHVDTEADQFRKVSTQLDFGKQTPCSERLQQHCIVTSTDTDYATLPEVENVIKSPKKEHNCLHLQSLLPSQNETKVRHQSINRQLFSKSQTETKQRHENISSPCIVSQDDNKDSNQNFSRTLPVRQATEMKAGLLNTNPFSSNQSSSSPQKESKSGQLNSNIFYTTSQTETKSGQLNSNQSSSSPQKESKSGQLNSNIFYTTSQAEIKSGQLNSNQSSSTPQKESKSGQLNSNFFSTTSQTETKSGQLNSNQSSTTPQKESKSGQPNRDIFSTTSPTETKSGQLNSNQSSSSPQKESKSGQLNSKIFYTTSQTEIKSGQSNSNQSSSSPQKESKSGQLNSKIFYTTSQNETKSEPANSNIFSTTSQKESKSEQLNSNQSYTTPQNETKPGQLNNNNFSTMPKSEMKFGHPPLTNQCSTQQSVNQSSKDSSDEAQITAYRSYRCTRLPGSEQFHRKLPMKRSVSSGALSLRDNNASFFRRINDSYIYSNDPAYESDDNDDFGIDLDEMFKHLDTRRSRKPTRSYCRSSYSEKDIAESVSDELATSTELGKSKRHECPRAIRETVSCDRLKIRRCALADPLRMIMSQEDRERIEKDVEKRRQSMVRRLSQFINIQFGLNKEEDLI